MILIVCKKVNRKKVAIASLAIITSFSVFVPLLFKKEKMPVSLTVEKVYMALVIDDFGNNSEGYNEFLNMDIPFTAAVMPGMPHSNKESVALVEKGKDVIIHMPMEAHTGKKSWLGPLALTTDMSKEDIAKILAESVSNINVAIGINNHMGSKATESEEIIGQVMEMAKKEGIIVLDSVTTNKSVIKKLGDEFGVTVFKRDVFLDGTQDVKIIEKNLDKAFEVAKKKGYSISIGHVGKEGGKATVNAINNKKEEFEKNGVEFITISNLNKLR